MAKQNSPDTLQQFETIKSKVLGGNFSPFYLLMGEEPYYVDLLCNIIMESALDPSERDFNQTVLYAADTSVRDIISICSRFPMMAQRQLVVIKEAQSLKKQEELIPYMEHLIDTTVFVLCYTGKSADKRTTFYKTAQKYGVVFESGKIPQESIPGWIEKYFALKGMTIEPQASLMLAEYAGSELRKIVLEIDKLLKSVSDSVKSITAEDIEKNVGISREFNVTELTNAISLRDAPKAFKIAYYFGESPKKYPLQMTLGFLFYFFSKIEQMHANSLANPRMSLGDAAFKSGLYPKYSGSYISAASFYNLRKTMRIINAIKECDYKSKSNYGGNATEGELLIELLGKIF